MQVLVSRKMGGIVARRLPTATSRAVAPLARFSTPPASPHRALSSSATRGGGFFELRQYDITPGGFKAYMEQTSTTAGVRRELFQTAESSWLAFFTTEIGPALSRVHHLYYYADYDVRDKVRSAVARDERWTKYLQAVKPHMVNQSSLIYHEATSVLKSNGIGGALEMPTEAISADSGSAVCYEMRRYQLKLGYPTVPDFMAAYGEGLADKLGADKSGASSLVTLLYNDVGPLNSVIELWRHESMQRSMDSRVASRQATLWKKAVAKNAELGISFDNQFLRPAPFSPWR